MEYDTQTPARDAHGDPRIGRRGVRMQFWKQRALALKQNTVALYFVVRDPRTPWYAKALVVLVVGYAVSPIDLIPDFIPVLGYLDDLLLLPVGIAIAIRLVPEEVMAESRARASEITGRIKTGAWVAAAAVVCVWCLLAAGVYLVFRRVG